MPQPKRLLPRPGWAGPVAFPAWSSSLLRGGPNGKRGFLAYIQARLFCYGIVTLHVQASVSCWTVRSVAHFHGAFMSCSLNR